VREGAERKGGCRSPGGGQVGRINAARAKNKKVSCRNSRPLTIACHMKNLYFDQLRDPLRLGAFIFSSLTTQIYCAFLAERKQLKVNSIISKADKKRETLTGVEFYRIYPMKPKAGRGGPGYPETWIAKGVGAHRAGIAGAAMGRSGIAEAGRAVVGPRHEGRVAQVVRREGRRRADSAINGRLTRRCQGKP
jgi:hypothetical protein